MATCMDRWQAHHMLHKLGSIGILLATALFTVGFLAPAWTTQFGLWMICSASCAWDVDSHSDVWITAVRVAESTALVVYIACCVVVVLEDCSRMYSVHSTCNRTVEILGGVAGITSLSGAIVFAICWSQDNTAFISSGSDSSHKDYAPKLHWAFGLVIAASIIILFSSIAIGCGRHRHSKAVFSSRNMWDSKTEGRNIVDDGVTFQHYPDPDTSSMMLVPASHFDTTSRSFSRETTDPPPYALPPPYPYRSPSDFFLPIALSSPLMVQNSGGVNSESGHSQGLSCATPSLTVASADTTVATPFSTSAFCIQSKRPLMKPLFIKTSNAGSEIEITPSAQNSSGLPSPFNHF